MRGIRTFTIAVAGLTLMLQANSALAQAEVQVLFVMDTRDGQKAREASYRLADCLQKHASENVDRLLAYNIPQAPRLAALLYSGAARRCVRTGIGVNPSVLYGALFKSGYFAETPNVWAESDLVEQASGYPDRGDSNDPVDYLLFADCIVSRNVGASHALLTARPGAPSELDAFAALDEDASACAASLDEPTVAATPFVLAVAQVAYRRSRAGSFDPEAEPADASRDKPVVKCERDRPDVCVVQPARGA